MSSYNQKYFVRQIGLIEKTMSERANADGESTSSTLKKSHLANSFVVASQLFNEDAGNLSEDKQLQDYEIEDDLDTQTPGGRVNKTDAIEGRSTVLLTMYGHILMAGRTYFQAIRMLLFFC
jgi:hypothetical protein